MHIIWKTLSAAALALALVPAHAEFVSIKGKQVNIRQAASTNAEVSWELTKGYPMKVTQKRGNWLKVRDFEGELGWVYQPLTAKQAHHIVKAPRANMRSGPGAQYKKVGGLVQYDLFQTLEKKSGWVKGKTSEGQVGWISKKLLWGW